MSAAGHTDFKCAGVLFAARRSPHRHFSECCRTCGLSYSVQQLCIGDSGTVQGRYNQLLRLQWLTLKLGQIVAQSMVNVCTAHNKTTMHRKLSSELFWLKSFTAHPVFMASDRCCKSRGRWLNAAVDTHICLISVYSLDGKNPNSDPTCVLGLGDLLH